LASRLSRLETTPVLASLQSQATAVNTPNAVDVSPYHRYIELSGFLALLSLLPLSGTYLLPVSSINLKAEQPISDLQKKPRLKQTDGRNGTR
jgi:hypothetical protein